VERIIPVYGTASLKIETIFLKSSSETGYGTCSETGAPTAF